MRHSPIVNRLQHPNAAQTKGAKRRHLRPRDFDGAAQGAGENVQYMTNEQLLQDAYREALAWQCELRSGVGANVTPKWAKRAKLKAASAPNRRKA